MHPRLDLCLQSFLLKIMVLDLHVHAHMFLQESAVTDAHSETKEKKDFK